MLFRSLCAGSGAFLQPRGLRAGAPCGRARWGVSTSVLSCLARRGGARPRLIWVFLVPGRLAAKPPFTAIGFPWILSSESRLINGLHGFFRNEFSPRLFPLRSRRGDGKPTVLGLGGAGLLMGQLNSGSDYPQAMLAFPDWGQNPNASRGRPRR